MSRASTSSFLLLISILAGGCSVAPSASEPLRATRWFAREETVAQLPADDAGSHTFVFAGQERLRTVTFSDRTGDLLRIDGEKVPLGTMDREIFFSPDGRHYAYPGLLGKGRVAVVDGQPRPGYTTQTDMTISDDSHHLAYIVGVKGTDYAVIDGQLQPLRGFARSDVIFSHSAKHWAYMVADRREFGNICMVVDGIKGPDYDQILGYQYEGDDLYYTAVRGKKWYMVTPAGPSQPHDQLGAVLVSPNERRRAWLVTDAQKFEMVIEVNNGLAHVPLSENTQLLLAIDNDGRAICAVGTKGNYELVIGDRRLPTDGLAMTAIADARSQHVAAVVVKEYGRNVSKGSMQTTQTQHVELDGQKQPEYLMVRSLTFSPRGTHLAYWAMRSDLRWTLVVDGEEITVFDSVPTRENRHWVTPVMSPAPITFSGEHTITALGINGREVTRVTLSAQ